MCSARYLHRWSHCSLDVASALRDYKGKTNALRMAVSVQLQRLQGAGTCSSSQRRAKQEAVLTFATTVGADTLCQPHGRFGLEPTAVVEDRLLYVEEALSAMRLGRSVRAGSEGALLWADLADLADLAPAEALR